MKRLALAVTVVFLVWSVHVIQRLALWTAQLVAGQSGQSVVLRVEVESQSVIARY